MKRKTIGLLLGTGLLSLGVFAAIPFNKKEQVVSAWYSPGNTHFNVSDTASELASYYSTISDSDTGTTLLGKLQSLNSTKRQHQVTYSTMGTSVSSTPYIYTDYDPAYATTDSNGQTYGTRILSFYTKTSVASNGGKEFNKEHVWPNSHGGDNVEDDILHSRPTISSENSSRGNSFYVEGENSSSAGWDPYTAGYAEWCRGECARIILYSVVAYSGFSLSALDSHATSNANPDNMMGNMNTLIKWHFAYTPNEYEMNRNNGAEYLQGNRNPFVDHPEYVAKIWSNFNSTVTNLCNNNSGVYANWTTGSYSHYGTNDAGTPTVGVSINKSTETIVTGNTTTISATSSNDSTISWTTSNSSVVSLSSASSSSGTSITLTGGSAGTATITAKATINNTLYSATCTVTVSDASDYTILPSDLANGTYPTTATDYTTASGLSIKAYNCANFSSKIQFKKSGGYLYNNSSINLSTMTLNGLSGTITVYAGSSSNPSSTTINGSNGVYNLSGYNYFKIINSSSNAATCNSIDITLASSSPTLSSISVATAPTKTTYTAGEYFDPTGLVITRNYSSGSPNNYAYAGHTSEFTFSPTTSTALTTSNTSVTITYGGKSCSQAITVNAAAITSITATVKNSKTFYVGETITASDISVKDNNNNDVTGFAFASYQFLYSDATSGGALTNKTFSNAISYNTLHCSLTARVQRKAYVAPSSVIDTITADDLAATTTSYVDFSGVSKSSGAVYAGNSAKNNNVNIQLRSNNSNSGIVSTTSGGTITSVKITVASGSNTIDVYGKNTAYSAASDLYSSGTQGTKVGSRSSTGTITFTTGYEYIGIRSNSGAVYISSIEITYGSAESAKNIANYVMYTDTNGQCTSKLNTALGYINNLSSSELTTWQEATAVSDYVIYTARTRFEAWARNQHKTITYTSAGHVTLSAPLAPALIAQTIGDSSTLIVIITTIITSLSISGFFFIKKKKHK